MDKVFDDIYIKGSDVVNDNYLQKIPNREFQAYRFIVRRLMEIKDIAMRIWYFRNRKNFSARELSLRLDKSPTYINQIECGNFKVSISNGIPDRKSFKIYLKNK